MIMIKKNDLNVYELYLMRGALLGYYFISDLMKKNKLGIKNFLGFKLILFFLFFWVI